MLASAERLVKVICDGNCGFRFLAQFEHGDYQKFFIVTKDMTDIMLVLK